MFGPTNYLPVKTFTDNKNATTSLNFTRNLHELKFKPGGNGRDGYIY
jgi:hypothetical protein